MKSGIEIFLCSALEDEPLRTKLEKHLQTLRRYGLINALWRSQDIVSGTEVDQEMSKYLKKAQLILLLISSSFLSSDDCYKIMSRAMDYHKKGKAHLIPVLLRPVHWKDAPFGKLKVLPANEKPITAWSNVDAALYDVADGIRQAIEDLAGKASSKLPSVRKTSRTVLAPHSSNFSFSLARTLLEHLGPVASVAFSSDGELLISDSWDNTIRVWNKDAGSILYTLKGHEGTVYSVVFSPDITTIVSGSDDCTVKIWEAQTGRELRVLTGHTGPVSSVALSADSMLLVSGSYDKTIKVWDRTAGQILQVLRGHTEPVSSVALSADSMLLVSGSYDKTIKVWDRATGRVLRTLRGHTGLISSVALSPDHKFLVSGGYDKTIKVWDTATGQLLEELTGHTEAVLSVAFHPNGTTIASGSLDKTIKIWQKPLIAPESEKNVSIAIIGGEKSGKSQYLAALVHQMQKAWAPQIEGQIQATSLNLDPENQYITRFLASSLGDEPDRMGPLVYQLVVRKRANPITVNLLLCIPTSTGEDMSDVQQMKQRNSFIAQADGIIVLADPVNMRNIRSQLPNHVLSSASPSISASDLLFRVGQIIGSSYGLRPSDRIDKPIAIVLSKSDLLRFLPSNEINHIQRALSYEETLHYLNNFSAVDQEVRSFLHTYGEYHLLRATDMFSNAQFFAASATGHSSSQVGNFAGMPEPHRCLDPLIWLLYQLGIIESENAE